MLDSKVFLYLEPIAPYRQQVKYITDLSPDKSYCKMDDMLSLIQTNHGFRRDVVANMRDLLHMGTPLILNIVKKTFFKFEEGSTIFRQASSKSLPDKLMQDRENTNKYVEKIVKSSLFTQ
jgi:hypothetical protein